MRHEQLTHRVPIVHALLVIAVVFFRKATEAQTQHAECLRNGPPHLVRCRVEAGKFARV